MLKKLQTPALLVAAVAMMTAFTVLSYESDNAQPTLQPRGDYKRRRSDLLCAG